MLGIETTSITFRGPAPTSHMTLASRGFSLRPASYISLVPRIRFIPIASPKLRPAPPTGPDWLHEVKFDGFRLQIHKVGDEVRLISRNGKEFH